MSMESPLTSNNEVLLIRFIWYRLKSNRQFYTILIYVKVRISYGRYRTVLVRGSLWMCCVRTWLQSIIAVGTNVSSCARVRVCACSFSRMLFEFHIDVQVRQILYKNDKKFKEKRQNKRERSDLSVDRKRVFLTTFGGDEIIHVGIRPWKEKRARYGTAGGARDIAFSILFCQVDRQIWQTPLLAWPSW